MNALTTTARPSLVRKIANRYDVDPDKMLETLKATVFKGNVSNEQMMALLIVADRYQLDPFTREIFAFPDKQSGVIPVVSVDGWSSIVSNHPQSNGYRLDDINDENGAPIACKGTMWRKDYAHPIEITEYFRECKRDTAPWKSHPHRMLRHKTFIQLARMALGFSGIYDQDEAERIAGGEVVVNLPPQASRTEQAKALLGKEPEPADVSHLEEAPSLPIADASAEPPWPTE